MQWYCKYEYIKISATKHEEKYWVIFDLEKKKKKKKRISMISKKANATKFISIYIDGEF